MALRDRDMTIGDALDRNHVSRRAFAKFCMAAASAMALPPMVGKAMAEQLRVARRPSVIYLSFQECTGCLESLTRSFTPSIEGLIFDVVSLDYNDTLMAASGAAAEEARATAIKENYGKYLVIVDGSVPMGDGGIYSCAGGRSAVDVLRETAKGAAAIVCVGTCSSFGGIPYADPNPTGALPVSDIIGNRPIINISGCPPIPEVITGTLLQYAARGTLPDLDAQRRPTAFFGNSIHDRCYRRPFYDQGKFAKSFDDEGARNGWCLYELGCKGPTTYNACATVKWNGGTSFPIESGHGCIGCSEPGFWDKGSLYAPLSAARWGKAGEATSMESLELVAGGAIVGAAVGAGAALLGRHRQNQLIGGNEPAAGVARAPGAGPEVTHRQEK